MRFQYKLFFIALVALSISLSSCSKDDETPKDPGTISLLFDNKLGGKNFTVKDAGDRSFDYKDANGQEYNISKYAYYISAIELLGPDNAKYADPLKVSAGEVTGYYHVTSLKPNSGAINLTNVTAGTYNKVRFTVGVAESGVQEGAAGGVLDPAKGAWFWNWNAGYIGFGVEGNASNSGQPYKDWGNNFITKEGTFAVHVGGWKDIEPQPGKDAKFVNNVKVIELDLDSNLKIEKGLSPDAHINVNFDQLLKGIDFSTTYAIHKPSLGKPFANKLVNVFELDHTHQ